MKLYLSSYYLGYKPELLHDILPVESRVAIIPNAGDYKRDVAARDVWVSEQAQEFARLGYIASNFDLREYFDGDTNKLQQAIRKFDMVWLTGGNSFVLRKAMAQSGFDTIITSMVNDNEIVYGGFSAGACVATPTLQAIELCDDPDATASGYSAETIWEGLNLVPYSIVPHYRSDHKESDAMEKVVGELKKLSLPYRTLSDGEVIIVDQ